MRRHIGLVVLGATLLAPGCKRGGNAAPSEVTEDPDTGSSAGSAGGFSAGLSADLDMKPAAKQGSDFFDTHDADAGSAAGSGSGAANVADAGSGSAVAAGSGSAVAANTGSAANAGSGSAVVDAGSAANAGSATTVAANAGSGSAVVADAGSAAAAKPIEASEPVIEMEPRKPLPGMTPELRAIQLSLLPNWERDTVEPASISLVVNMQSRNIKQTFTFHYGYEDPKAPTDREAFKKYLAEQKIIRTTTDRQRGAAWYLEGDGAFRLIVTYGGKRLYCGGSTYKSSGLGDIRDEVIIQAKKICETVSL